jgi:hypothetical protein
MSDGWQRIRNSGPHERSSENKRQAPQSSSLGPASVERRANAEVPATTVARGDGLPLLPYGPPIAAWRWLARTAPGTPTAPRGHCGRALPIRSSLLAKPGQVAFVILPRIATNRLSADLSLLQGHVPRPTGVAGRTRCALCPADLAKIQYSTDHCSRRLAGVAARNWRLNCTPVLT